MSVVRYILCPGPVPQFPAPHTRRLLSQIPNVRCSFLSQSFILLGLSSRKEQHSLEGPWLSGLLHVYSHLYTNALVIRVSIIGIGAPLEPEEERAISE